MNIIYKTYLIHSAFYSPKSHPILKKNRESFLKKLVGTINVWSFQNISCSTLICSNFCLLGIFQTKPLQKQNIYCTKCQTCLRFYVESVRIVITCGVNVIRFLQKCNFNVNFNAYQMFRNNNS